MNIAFMVVPPCLQCGIGISLLLVISHRRTSSLDDWYVAGIRDELLNTLIRACRGSLLHGDLYEWRAVTSSADFDGHHYSRTDPIQKCFQANQASSAPTYFRNAHR
jgi:hypothetical protein